MLQPLLEMFFLNVTWNNRAESLNNFQKYAAKQGRSNFLTDFFILDFIMFIFALLSFRWRSKVALRNFFLI